MKAANIKPCFAVTRQQPLCENTANSGPPKKRRLCNIDRRITRDQPELRFGDPGDAPGELRKGRVLKFMAIERFKIARVLSRICAASNGLGSSVDDGLAAVRGPVQRDPGFATSTGSTCASNVDPQRERRKWQVSSQSTNSRNKGFMTLDLLYAVPGPLSLTAGEPISRSAIALGHPRFGHSSNRSSRI